MWIGKGMKHLGISKELAYEIEKKLDLIKEIDIPERVLRCNERMKKAILENAQIHSYRIEHPYENVPFSVPRNRNRKGIKEGIIKIQNAFNWGCENFDENNFDESFIRGIAARLTPDLHDGKDIAQYRSKGTAIRGATVTPPYPEKLVYYEIPWFADNLKAQLNSEKLIDIVETAIFAHFHITRMHPFEDGNGRTSRTFQDVILDRYEIPLPVIQAGERGTYYHFLRKADEGWKDNGGRASKNLSQEEISFYDFIAGKINISLDKIIDVCYPSH